MAARASLVGLRLVPVVGAVVLVILIGQHAGEFRLGQFTYVAIYFVALLGLNVLTGYNGQISLGHGAFMAIGGYTTAILYRDHADALPWHSTLSTIPVAAAAAFVVGVVVGIPALRLHGVYLALATFAVALVVPALANKYTHFSGGRDGILLPIRTGHWSYVAGWSIAGGMFVLAWLLLRGRIGRAWRAIRDSDVAAVSAGVNLAVYKTFAFAVSAAFAGFAGGLFVLLSGLAQPDEFGLLLSVELVLGAAVAGLGSLWGVLGGAFFVYYLRVGAQGTSIGFLNQHKYAAPVLQVIAVILVMFVLPTGLAGLLRRIGAPAGRLLAVPRHRALRRP
jgi:branched-chain amino acid transport system permease protein